MKSMFVLGSDVCYWSQGRRRHAKVVNQGGLKRGTDMLR
jgi:hypothetical protein